MGPTRYILFGVEATSFSDGTVSFNNEDPKRSENVLHGVPKIPPTKPPAHAFLSRRSYISSFNKSYSSFPPI